MGNLSHLLVVVQRHKTLYSNNWLIFTRVPIKSFDMKNLILVCFTLLTFNFATAQECSNGWLPFEKGVKFEHTNYNKKGKVESINSAEIVGVSTVDGGERAEVKVTATDKKGKSTVPETMLYYTCSGDTYEMDMSDFLNSITANLPADVTIDIDGSKLIFPKNMKVGDELPEAHIDFSATMMGMKLMGGKITQTNRKVIGEETITTAMGTYDCMKITETINSDFSMAKITTETTSWIAKGIGMVRQETMKAGEMESYIELTKFSK